MVGLENKNLFWKCRKINISRICMVQQQENMEKKLIQAPNTFNIGVASLKGIGSQVPVLWQL